MSFEKKRPFAVNRRVEDATWIDIELRRADVEDPRISESLQQTVEFACQLTSDIRAEIERSLAQPGLEANWRPGLVAAREGDSVVLRNRDGERIAEIDAELADAIGSKSMRDTSAQNWDSRILELWNAGLVYLADEASEVSSSARWQGAAVILRRSVVEEGATFRGGSILCEDVSIAGTASIAGDSYLHETILQEHVVLRRVLYRGGFVNSGTHIEEARLGAGVTIGPQVSIVGVHHPSFYPEAESSPWGVEVGESCMIGSQAFLAPGSRVGAGAFIAAQGKVEGIVGPYCLYQRAGVPQMPLDSAVRGLTPSEAFERGARAGGLTAGEMTLSGRFEIGIKDEKTLQVDFPEHQYLMKRASEQCLHWQHGALVGFLGRYFRIESSEVLVGSSVRFEVMLGSVLRPMEHNVGTPRGLPMALRGELESASDVAPLPVGNHLPLGVGKQREVRSSSSRPAANPSMPPTVDVLAFLKSITKKSLSEGVSLDSSLFEIGLSSLNVLSLIDALEDRGIVLSHRETEELQTVADLGRWLAQASAAP